jgi:predicted flap endonuclease-1-like 5' DNA nuclease
MLYLASQFVWFLVAAFALGLIMGWISQDGGKLELWSHKLAYAAAVWALGAVLTWTQTLNGVSALWVETALLFVAVYAAGCAAGATLKTALEPKALAQAITGLDGVSTLDEVAAALAGAGPGSTERAASYVASAREALDTTRDVSARVAEVKSVADDGKTVIKDIKGLGKAGKEQVATGDVAVLPGERPAGLVAARGGAPDDLKLIKGIGRQNEGRLHGLGIWHFDQIAAWTADNVEWVGGYLAFPGRIEREDWVGQARALASGAETAFARRTKSGTVASSRDDGLFGQGNVAVLHGGEFDGEKPGNLLAAARDGKPDDLVLIKGIGPAIAADLNRLGIWHFDQIAALREPELRYLCAFADTPATNARTWREDADILAHGGETAHSRALKAERGKN